MLEARQAAEQSQEEGAFPDDNNSEANKNRNQNNGNNHSSNGQNAAQTNTLSMTTEPTGSEKQTEHDKTDKLVRSKISADRPETAGNRVISNNRPECQIKPLKFIS